MYKRYLLVFLALLATIIPASLSQGATVLVDSYRYSSVVSPIPTTNLVGWYDATDTATLTTSGSNVTGWADKSGAGNNITGVSGNYPQTGTRSVNGLNALDFNGTSQHLPFPSALYSLSSGDNTVYIVNTFDTNIQMASIHGQDSGSNRYRQIIQGPLNAYHGTALTAFPGYSYNSNFNLYEQLFSGTSITLGINGSTATTASAGSNFTMVNFYIGAQNGSSNWLDGAVAEIIFYNRALNTSERNQVIGYLCTKYAFTCSTIP